MSIGDVADARITLGTSFVEPHSRAAVVEVDQLAQLSVARVLHLAVQLGRARTGDVESTLHWVNEHLMHALLYAALFLDTSTEDECDPDLAVKRLEEIAWSLRQMSPDDQECFRRYAYREAEAHPVASVADEIRSLVDSALPQDDE